MKKRLLTLALVGTMVVNLAACGSKEEKHSGEDSTGTMELADAEVTGQETVEEEEETEAETQEVVKNYIKKKYFNDKLQILQTWQGDKVIREEYKDESHSYKGKKYMIKEREYDDVGELKSESYYGLDGEFVIGQQWEWDEEKTVGKCIETDGEGNESIIQEEYREYDSEGHILNCKQYYTDNSGVLYLRYENNYTYDEDGIVSETWINYHYDGEPNEITEYFYESDGTRRISKKILVKSDIEYTYKYTYSKYGLSAVEAIGKHGDSEWISRKEQISSDYITTYEQYNEDGELEETGKIICDAMGNALYEEYSYLQEGTRTEIEYVSENKVSSRMTYINDELKDSLTYEYDEEGRVTKVVSITYNDNAGGGKIENVSIYEYEELSE